MTWAEGITVYWNWIFSIPWFKSSLLTVHVNQELRKVKEFRDELFDIIWIIDQYLPWCWNGMKLTIRKIKSNKEKTARFFFVKLDMNHCHQWMKVFWLTQEWEQTKFKGNIALHQHEISTNLPLCNSIWRVVNGSIRIM